MLVTTDMCGGDIQSLLAHHVVLSFNSASFFVEQAKESVVNGVCFIFLQYDGRTVLIGVDDMDMFKGIELKLQAVERVLDHHPEWRGRLTLLQVTNAPRLVCPQ